MFCKKIIYLKMYKRELEVKKGVRNPDRIIIFLYKIFGRD